MQSFHVSLQSVPHTHDTHMQVIGLAQSAYSAGKRSTTKYSVNGFVYSSTIFIYVLSGHLFSLINTSVCAKTNFPPAANFSISAVSFYWDLILLRLTIATNCQYFSIGVSSFIGEQIPSPSSIFCHHLSADNDGCIVSNSSRKIGSTGVALPSPSTHPSSMYNSKNILIPVYRENAIFLLVDKK